MEYGWVRIGTELYGLWRLLNSRHYQSVDALGSGVRLWAFGWQPGAATAATTRLGSHRTTARCIVTAASVHIRTYPYPAPLRGLTCPTCPTFPANNKKTPLLAKERFEFRL